MEYFERAMRAYRLDGLRSIIGGLKRNTMKQLATSSAHPLFRRCSLSVPLYFWAKEREYRDYLEYILKSNIGEELAREPLRERKSSDTVFILGSGSSINDISAGEWETVGQHDSFGLNKWPIHDFVPTFQVFELPTGAGASSKREFYWSLFETKQVDYADVPVIMKDAPYVFDELGSEPIPDYLERRLLLSLDIELPRWDDSTELLRDVLRWLDSSGMFSIDSDILPLYRKRGSISYLLFLATKLGYERIVLAGVDLNDARYFYEERHDEYESRGIPLPDTSREDDRDKDDVHRTNDPKVAAVTLEDVIYTIDKTILAPNDIELYTATKQSSLYPTLDYYEIDEADTA